MTEILVYILCALTSLLCALLLYRSYRRVPLPLLFWSCVCFGCLAATNILLFIDLVLLPNVDLLLLRDALSLTAVSTLIYGITTEVI